MDTVIKIEHVSKSYKLYDKNIDRLKESIHPFRKQYHKDFFALNDISFDIKKGETVGIIGKNGSGKSTLLQIVTGVLTPTSGLVTVNGKVSALLELGAGFNPEFTGIENIYFNGSIMGYTTDEMDEKLDEILAFADIGDFVHQPVKTYSSGMYVRLAFSVAINVDPDILIVDEALSVGDMFFQQKCILRMRKMIERGITMLFVSHDHATIQSICNRGVLLESGFVKMIGDAKTVSMEYIKEIHNNQNDILQEIILEDDTNKVAIDNENSVSPNKTLTKDDFIDDGIIFDNKLADRFGDDTGWIKNVKILNSKGEIVNQIEYREPFTVRVYLQAQKDLKDYCIGFRIWDDKGLSIAGTTNIIERINLPDLKINSKVIHDFFVENIFSAGSYSVSAGIEKVVIQNKNHFVIDAVMGADVFQVQPADNPIDNMLAKVYVPIQISSYTI